MKKIVRLTESDLLHLVKRVIKEQNTSLTPYDILPIKQGAPRIKINVDLKNQQIFLPDGTEVGFKDRYDCQNNIGSPKFNAGNEYLDTFLGEWGVSKFLQLTTCKYFGFWFENGEPTIGGLNKGSDIFCLGSVSKPGIGTNRGDKVITTTTTRPPETPKQPISFELENAFHYDCPGKKGCGTKVNPKTGNSGSNEEPLINMDNLKKVKRLGRFLASISNFPIIKNTKFYVVGYASAENKNNPDFINHNRELSKNRAQYIVLYLNDAIKQNGGTITVGAIGQGATEKFGKDLESNRKIILTTDPNSLTPTKFVIIYDENGKIIDVKLE
jgi:hypothetical protein